MVKFNIASVHDVSPRRFYYDRHRVGYRMCHRKKSNLSFTELQNFIFFDFSNIYLARLRKFFLSFFYHLCGKTALVDRRISYAIDDVGNASDMIKMPVRDDKPANLVSALFQVSGIWKNVIYSRRVFLAESESAINDENIAAEFDCRHVWPISSTPPSGIIRTVSGAGGGMGATAGRFLVSLAWC